eukprot:636149-Rhodomonas_salina.1
MTPLLSRSSDRSRRATRRRIAISSTWKHRYHPQQASRLHAIYTLNFPGIFASALHRKLPSIFCVPLITGVVLQVLVAYSPSYYFGLHAWMHSQEINLVADHPHKHSSVSGEMYEDIVMPDFLVPNDDATQSCGCPGTDSPRVVLPVLLHGAQAPRGTISRILLRAQYRMSGTDLGYPLPVCPVLTSAMPCQDKKYHMIRAEPIFGSSHPGQAPMVLRRRFTTSSSTVAGTITRSNTYRHARYPAVSEPKCNDEAHAMQVPTPLSPYAASRTNLAHAVRCPVLTSATLCSVQYELWKRAGILQYDCTYSGNAVQD